MKSTAEERGGTVVPSSSSKGPPLSPPRFLYDSVVLPAHLLCTEPVVFSFTLLSALSYVVVLYQRRVSFKSSQQTMTSWNTRPVLFKLL